MTFRPESPETIEENALAAGRAYARQFRDKWYAIEQKAVAVDYSEVYAFVGELLDVIEIEHRDHVTVVAQCINMQNWLAEKAGVTSGNDSSAD